MSFRKPQQTAFYQCKSHGIVSLLVWYRMQVVVPVLSFLPATAKNNESVTQLVRELLPLYVCEMATRTNGPCLPRTRIRAAESDVCNEKTFSTGYIRLLVLRGSFKYFQVHFNTSYFLSSLLHLLIRCYPQSFRIAVSERACRMIAIISKVST